MAGNEKELSTREQSEQLLNGILIEATEDALKGLRQTSRALNRMLNVLGIQQFQPIVEAGKTIQDMPEFTMSVGFETAYSIQESTGLNIKMLQDILNRVKQQNNLELSVGNNVIDTLGAGRDKELELLANPDKYIGNFLQILPKPEEQK